MNLTHLVETRTANPFGVILMARLSSRWRLYIYENYIFQRISHILMEYQIITLRVSDQLKNRIADRARSSGLDMSNFLRAAITNIVEKGIEVDV